jgi:hypothetical protein
MARSRTISLVASVFALQIAWARAECQSRCLDSPVNWLDTSVSPAWSCEDYRLSALQGNICGRDGKSTCNFCGSDGSGQACCFCGGGTGGEECAKGCQDTPGWKDSNGWTCADYAWSAIDYCGWEDSSTACCTCKGAASLASVTAPYCEDKANWKDSKGYTCADYAYEKETNGNDWCGAEDSAAACCFCGGGSHCKPCGANQFHEACGDCRDCSTAPSCPAGTVRSLCGYGNVGSCVNPKTAKNANLAGGSATGTRLRLVVCILLSALNVQALC